MHEFSAIHTLAETIREHTPPGGRLVTAQVAVGALEHLDPALLQTAWAAVMGVGSWVGAPLDPSGPRGSLAPSPTLELSHEDARVRCRHCRREYWPPNSEWMACPRCGQGSPEVLSGTGLTLLSLSFQDTAHDGSGPPAPQPRGRR